MAIAILLSTCDKYREISIKTCDILSRYWENLPELYLCGLSSPLNGFNTIPLANDERDWMSITRSACIWLKNKGFNKIYLILDDHPPLGTCHHWHLNKILPHIMDELQATVISLYGWGQGGGTREPNGTILGKEFYNIEKLSLEYPWKFSLHPALWNLTSLITILDQLILMLPSIAERSPWKFERISGNYDFPVPDLLKSNSYRICGKAMTFSKGRMLLHQCEIAICDCIHFIIQKILGKEAWGNLYLKLGYIYHYYEGPYPIFWSGILKKGQVNPEFKKYLIFHRKGTYFSKLLKSFLRS